MKSHFLKLSFIMAFLYFFPFQHNIFSQEYGAIKGIVKDSATGETIPYAIVQIAGTKNGTNANVNGFYYLNNISFGKVKIFVSAVGYQKKTISISMENNEIKLYNVFLPPEPKELKAVIKTAERNKEAYETNLSVQVITQDEIKMVPRMVEQDIFRIIKIIPGVSSTGDVTSQFYVRGGKGDQNLILYDNMMIYNPFHALGLFSVFNASSIKVYEVLTGGFKPEFGGRLSSVINIFSKDGNSNQYAANLNAGMLSAQGLFEGPLLNGSFIASFRKSYFDGVFKKMLGQELPLNFYDLTGKITQSISSEGKVTLNYLSSHDEIKNSAQNRADYLWDNNAFGLNLSTFIDNYFANVSVSASRFSAAVDYKDDGGRKKDESIVSNFYFNSKIEFRTFDKDLASVGFSMLFPNTSIKLNNSSDLYVERNENTHEINFWLNYEFKQWEKFKIDFGIRSNIEYITDDLDLALEPRLGLKYDLSPDLALKGSFSRYRQFMVTTSNEDDVIPLFESWLPVKSPFIPEQCDEYVLGFDMVPIENGSFKMQGYYKYFRNLLGYNLNKTTVNDPDFSAGKEISYGLESTLKFQVEKLFLWLNYTISWAKEKRDNVVFNPRYDKRHMLNFMAVYKLPWDIDMNLHWEVSSGSPFTPFIGYYDNITTENLLYNYLFDKGRLSTLMGIKNSKTLPYYHKLDLGFSKSFIFAGIKINANFDINNLYDHKNIFYYIKETGEKMYMLPFLPSFSIGVEL
jgi:hypothetical protein